MSYQPPSLDQISKRLRAAVKAQVPGAEPGLWPNNLSVLLKALTPMFAGLYERIEQVHFDAHPATAASDGLERGGAEIGVTRRAAQVASGTGTATVLAGTVIPAGARFTRADGAEVVNLDPVTALTTSATLRLRAREAGAAGNALGGVSLTPVTPISGLSALTIDDAGMAGGADVENDASLRARILNRKRNPPQAGSPADYVDWAMSQVGVTRAFVQRATPSAGHVTVYFMMDNSYATGVPAAGDVNTMTVVLRRKAPADAAVTVAAPILDPVNVTITGLSPDSPQIRAAIAQELRQMFYRRAEPGGEAGASFTFPIAWLTEAIAAAAPSLVYTLTAPSVAPVAATGHLSGLGTLTFA